MTVAWQWQDDMLWQSCSPAAHSIAQTWQSEIAKHHVALQRLAAQQPLNHLAQDASALAECLAHAAELRQVSSELVVVGTGGASLGAHALCALAPSPNWVKFLENCDPVTVRSFLHLPLENTSWCIISKSGETVETLVATLTLIQRYRGEEENLRERVRVITADSNSTLGKLAAAQGWTILPHPPSLGGRYSVLSIVGMLPAAFAGLDVPAIVAGAHRAMQSLLEAPDETFWRHACWIAATAKEKPMQVLMAYADRLRYATQWFKQLWAESLGKNGRGQTPITAIGAIDQHSQLQLYLDGPRDKLLTLWLPETPETLDPLPHLAVPGTEFLQGQTMAAVMQATAEATVTTMRAAGLPLRVLRGRLTAETLAAWMGRQMLETLAVAHLLEVDPYSQPAVEGGKRLTREALAKSATGRTHG